MRGTRETSARVGAALALFLLVSCEPPDPPHKATVPTAPREMCVRGLSRPCRPGLAIEARLRRARVVLAQPLSTGSQGARRLALQDGDVILHAKYRDQASATASNDPAAELIAYRTQELFLDPRDYVVPPTIARCFAPDLRWLDRVEGELGCALGILSYWLDDTVTLVEARRLGIVHTPPGGLWSADPRLVGASDRPSYRRSVAHANLVAYLIGHGDAHTGQFVLQRDPLHLFLVDNSRALDTRPNREMASREDLAELVVDAIPADTARRIEALTSEDLEPLSRVVAFARRGSDLVPVEVARVVGEPDRRLRVTPEHVQIGLGPSELDAMERRLRHLQARLRAGSLATY